MMACGLRWRRQQRASKPIVIADTQDNPGAGGDSDTTGMLRALVRNGATNAAIGVIVDPESAKAAHAAGPGAIVRLALGGKSGIPGDAPFEHNFVVETLSDGKFAAPGPYFGGSMMNLGPSACLRVGGVRVVVGSRKAQLADQAMFRFVGIEPSEQSILVNKSSVHFRADFEPIAEKIIICAAPGRNAGRYLDLAVDAAASRRPPQAERNPVYAGTETTFHLSCHRITKMPNIERIEGFADELTAIRRDFHAHPEIGFEEVRTSGIVADKLTQWGIEVHRGLGGTGVVGVLKGKGAGGKRIGLRADMDALPMEENTNLKWRSTIPGRFHGCGHDGHTTMLLGTARYLAETRNFDGTVHFIFQPAEEGLGGARAMIKDGLFEKFPCDEIYGLHNAPDLNHGELAILPGPAMAGADFFDIVITGYGAHGATPENSKDPVVIAMTLGQALQTIVSRNVNPLQVGGAVDHADPCRLRLQRHSRRSETLRHGARVRRWRARADPRAHAHDLCRHRKRLPGRDRGRYPRYLQRSRQQRGAFESHRRGRAYRRRSGESHHPVDAENGQRGFRRHAARRARRLFLARPGRLGAPA